MTQSLQSLSDTLWNARSHQQPCSPLTELKPDLTLADSYGISRLVLDRRLSGSPGIRLVGRKIGLTSVAVQRQLGVDQPDFGYLTSDMLVDAGGIVPGNQLLQPRVEGEVAFLLGKDLKGPGIRHEDVVAATDHVVACIEVIDSRIRDWKIAIQDTVADNASSAFVVLGTQPRKLKDLDLRMAGMVLRINGEIRSTGMGAACLNDPVDAVAWLANTLGKLGDGLKAGDIVLSGAYGPVVAFGPGDFCEVEIHRLGKVSCTRQGPAPGTSQLRIPKAEPANLDQKHLGKGRGDEKMVALQEISSRVTVPSVILADAFLNAREIDRITSQPGLTDLSIDEAYFIQHEVLKNLSDHGHHPIGYKMGLTSKAKMKQMGVHSPIYGVLTDRMQLPSGARISLQGRIHPKIEPELAVIMGRDIQGPVDPEEALAACSGVCAAMEIIDSRFRNFQFTLPDVIADNCSAAAFVLGDIIRSPDILSFDNLGNLGMLLEINGEAADFGSSAAIFNHPAASLAQLIHMLWERDQGLKAGDIVLVGSPTPALPLSPGMTVQASVQDLGSVRIEMQG